MNILQILDRSLLPLVPPRARRLAYRLGPFTAMIRKFLATEAGPVEREVTVSRGPLRGSKLRLDLRLEKSLWLGTHEPDVERVLTEWVQPHDVCADIGAHVGYFSLLLSRLVGADGRVMAFEPHPTTFQRLEEHLRINRIANAEVFRLALGAEPGCGRLHAKPGGDTSEFHLAILSKGGNRKDGLSVRVDSLDVWLSRRRGRGPSLLKIDAEGAEGEILSGARRFLRRDRPVVLCEIHGREPGRLTWSILKEAGYEFESVEERRRLLAPPVGGHILALPLERVMRSST